MEIFAFTMHYIQAFLMIAVGVLLLKIKTTYYGLALHALIFMMIIAAVRVICIQLYFLFGFHTVILAILFTIFFRLIYQVAWSYATLVMLIDFILMLLPNILPFAIAKYLHIDLSLQMILKEGILYVLTYIFENSLLLLFLGILVIRNRTSLQSKGINIDIS